MSLYCYECREELHPSDSFPGREAVLVYPSLLAMVYLPAREKSNEISGISGYKLNYLQADANIAICFNCIETRLPPECQNILKMIYSACETEIEYNKLELAHIGKWIDEIPEEELKARSNLWDEFKKRDEALPKGCIACGGNVKNGKPFFTAGIIDRVNSRKTSIVGNYNTTGVRHSMVHFGMCCDDFIKYFPNSFEDFSYTLLGEKNPNFTPLSEINIGPGFEESFEEQTGKSLDDFLKENSDALAGSIIIIDKKDESKNAKDLL